MTWDTHTHLERLDDPDQAITDAFDAGITGIVTVGMHPDSIRTSLAIARRHPGRVLVAAGIHPHNADDADDDDWDAVCELAHDPLVCAIGETGFDRFRNYSDPRAQDALFVRHAELARERSLPLIIHTRAADEHTLEMLDTHASGLEVILHCFSMADQIDHVNAHGWYVSFAGNVSYGSAEDLRAAAARVDPSRILFETDAPYLAPVPHRGEKNRPAWTLLTRDVVAHVRGMDPLELGAIAAANAERVFGPVTVAADA